MSLHNVYRPPNWDMVIGHAPQIKSIRSVLQRNGSQCFLLASISPGIGKTTFAFLIAKDFGCTPDTIMEIDAATFTGIDAMRAIRQTTEYVPLGQSSKRAVIVDECHRLSGQAWDSLLKAIEKPPSHVIWIFATTNLAKVPATIKSRAAKYVLNPLSNEDLGTLFDEVCEAENIKLPDDVGDLIISTAKGSPRDMLTGLEACRAVTSKREAAQLLQTAMDGDATIELCRYLCNPTSWAKAMAIVDKFSTEENWEGVRIVAANYMGKALKGAKTDKDAVFFLTRVEAFSQPYNPSEGIAPLLRSIGQIIYN